MDWRWENVCQDMHGPLWGFERRWGEVGLICFILWRFYDIVSIGGKGIDAKVLLAWKVVDLLGYVVSRGCEGWHHELEQIIAYRTLSLIRLYRFRTRILSNEPNHRPLISHSSRSRVNLLHSSTHGYR